MRTRRGSAPSRVQQRSWQTRRPPPPKENRVAIPMPLLVRAYLSSEACSFPAAHIDTENHRLLRWLAPTDVPGPGTHPSPWPLYFHADTTVGSLARVCRRIEAQRVLLLHVTGDDLCGLAHFIVGLGEEGFRTGFAGKPFEDDPWIVDLTPIRARNPFSPGLKCLVVTRAE